MLKHYYMTTCTCTCTCSMYSTCNYYSDNRDLSPVCVHVHVHNHFFMVSIVSRVVDRCRQCRELDNQARGREDFTLYRAMLKTIRHTEETYKDNSHVIFLLQVNTRMN